MSVAFFFLSAKKKKHCSLGQRIVLDVVRINAEHEDVTKKEKIKMQRKEKVFLKKEQSASFPFINGNYRKNVEIIYRHQSNYVTNKLDRMPLVLQKINPNILASNLTM